MPIGHKTKWFSSSMGGASQVSNAAGHTISNILNPCLVSGFGSVTLDSLIIADGVATLTKSAGHGFLDYQVIEIAGATPSALNGQHRLTRVSSTVGTFDATGIANQTATGTITAKTPALGWTGPYTGTNLAAYRGNTASGTGCYLRVDDTATTLPRVRGYVAMTDVNTGTDPFPTDALLSGGGYFPKSSSSTLRSWLLVGNDRGFYISADYNNNWHLAAFMDLQTLCGLVDPYACILQSCNVTAPGYLSYLYNYSGSQQFIARKYDASANSAQRTNCLGPGNYSGVNQAPVSYWTHPPVIAGANLPGISPIFIGEYQGQLRGTIPGYIGLMSNCRTSFSSGDILTFFGYEEKAMFFQEYNVGAIAVYLGEWT